MKPYVLTVKIMFEASIEDAQTVLSEAKEVIASELTAGEGIKGGTVTGFGVSLEPI